MAFEHNLALGEGGPDLGDEDLVAIAGHFAEMARRLASEVEPTPSSISEGTTPSPPQTTAARGGRQWGSRHLQRLGGVPPGARPLDGIRVELAVGTWRDWFPDDPDRQAAVQQQARALLADVLSEPEMLRLSAERNARAREGRPGD